MAILQHERSELMMLVGALHDLAEKTGGKHSLYTHRSIVRIKARLENILQIHDINTLDEIRKFDRGFEQVYPKNKQHNTNA